MKKPSRRERGELPIWRLALAALLGNAMRVLILGYVGATIWLIVTDGFKGWW